jgi:hypothetical protein
VKPPTSASRKTGAPFARHASPTGGRVAAHPQCDGKAPRACGYTAADPSSIDTIEYCYLEGQQGVYIETRQGFEVDGVEIKARLDFAAAAIDFRGLQKNTA